MPCESLVGSPGNWGRQQGAGNGLLNSIGRALVVGAGTTAFPCVCADEQQKDVHIVLPLGSIFHVFNTRDKPKSCFQWVWGPIILVLSQGAQPLLTVIPWLLQTTVLGSAQGKGRDVRYSSGSGVAQGYFWKGRSALPRVELLQWCYSLSKRIIFFGCSHLFLVYT